ncbi:MAG TPA: hypothetical protein VFV54_06845, partial [Thermoanaerobaculia bacterium]|nr:hypothetical protein [Thermoanaerobaculia bacterium]
AAAASPAVTRADLATLVYWSVSGVRFGRPPAEPAIAIDIADAEARDEIVRAIAFGLLSVDPVTRRVDPYRTMSASSVARFLFRVMALTANPPCMAVPQADSSSHGGILRMLQACGVDTTALSDPTLPVSGSAALASLRKIDAMRVR